MAIGSQKHVSSRLQSSLRASGPDLSRRSFLTGLAAAVATPALAVDRSRIEIEGNCLTHGGVPLRLAGVAVGDPVYIRGGRPLSDYAVIARDWGANCVRISTHPGHWRADPVAMLAAIATNVGAARAEDLFVILDWHAIGFPDHYQPIPPPEWGLPADAYLADMALTKSFWRAMAQQFGSDPAILFEIWNEPVIDETLWVSTGQHWPLLKSAWREIIAEIRAISDSIVLCSGGRWAHDLVGVRSDPVDDARTAYAWHVYPGEDRDRPDRWFTSLDGLHQHKPVIVTEWGFCPDCDGSLGGTAQAFGEPFVDAILDAFGLGHTAWCYSAGAAPALLAADGTTPSAYGFFVREHLRRLAGLQMW